MKRKGLGKGLGKGYYNIVPIDSHIHRLSARGIKSATAFDLAEFMLKGDTNVWAKPQRLDAKLQEGYCSRCGKTQPLSGRHCSVCGAGNITDKREITLNARNYDVGYILQKDCFSGKKGDLILVDEKGESSSWFNVNKNSIGSPFVEYDCGEKITKSDLRRKYEEKKVEIMKVDEELDSHREQIRVLEKKADKLAIDLEKYELGLEEDFDAKGKKKYKRHYFRTPEGATRLHVQQKVTVPSTEYDKPIPQWKFQKRVDEVQKWLSKTYGGETTMTGDGGYVSKDGQLIEEPVMVVTAFSDTQKFNENKDVLIDQLKRWKNKWKQESIAYQYEDDLFFIE